MLILAGLGGQLRCVSLLRHRRPDLFFVDEDRHLAKIVSGHKLQDQLDCIKSLSNPTGILHGLIGT